MTGWLFKHEERPAFVFRIIMLATQSIDYQEKTL
jgi:hypothetical protein